MVGGDERPVPGARIVVTTVTQSLGARGVVAAGELLNPTPGVPGDLHDPGGGVALADKPEDLVMATLDRIVGLSVTVFQHFGVQMRNYL